MNKKNPLSISVIVPMWNAETTIEGTLDSIKKQKYPIKEIIVIDNNSDDNSLKVAEKYKQKNKNLPIRIIKQPVNKGLGASYNLGLKESKSNYTVITHSDISLASDKELGRLIKPFEEDTDVIATYSWTLQPESLWEKFPFWEKCLFAREVGRVSPNMSGLFDCIKTDVARKINGYNLKDFGDVGGEDADFYLRIIKKGKVVVTKAKVIHVHYFKKDYSFANWMLAKKKHACVYGRLLRVHGLNLQWNGIIAMSIKPILVVTSFIPPFNIVSIAVIIFLAIYQTKKLFMTKSTLFNPRILFLPFINIFFIYYQTFWTLRTFLSRKAKLFLD